MTISASVSLGLPLAWVSDDPQAESAFQLAQRHVVALAWERFVAKVVEGWPPGVRVLQFRQEDAGLRCSMDTPDFSETFMSIAGALENETAEKRRIRETLEAKQKAHFEQVARPAFVAQVDALLSAGPFSLAFAKSALGWKVGKVIRVSQKTLLACGAQAVDELVGHDRRAVALNNRLPPAVVSAQLPSRF